MHEAIWSDISDLSKNKAEKNRLHKNCFDVIAGSYGDMASWAKLCAARVGV